MQKSASYYGQLLENYLDGAVSVDEANELFDFIKQQPVEARELLKASGNADHSHRFMHLEDIDASTSQRMLDRLLSSISSSEQSVPLPVHRVHFLKTSWFRYAAAVFILTGSVVFFVLNSGGKEGQSLASDNKPLQTDIAPGTSKAVLTLADGSTIVLDDVQNGNLVQQGNAQVVKLANGQLAYNVESGVPGGKVAFNTLSAPRGGQYTVILPDGSKVWLNAASSITYPTVFAGAERTVEVTGEAYMEIAKNSRQPFMVKVNGVDIRVLGTSFNVNAYTDEDAVRTTLIDGSVKILKGSAEALLRPGQQAEAADNTDRLKVENVDTEQALAWKNGLFSFNNADIKTIMRQLSRWYDINIVYENGVPAQRFFGEMNRSLTLSQVLKGLEVTKVRFRLEGRDLIVMP